MSSKPYEDAHFIVMMNDQSEHNVRLMNVLGRMLPIMLSSSSGEAETARSEEQLHCISSLMEYYRQRYASTMRGEEQVKYMDTVMTLGLIACKIKEGYLIQAVNEVAVSDQSSS